MLKAQFDAVIADLTHGLLHAPIVPAKSWQSTEAPQGMPEVFNYSFTLDLTKMDEGEELTKAISPNQPWADRHFASERMSGQPINPGETYKIWQDGKSAANHLKEGAQFDHSYAERYWPRFAGQTPGGKLAGAEGLEPRQGYRFRYGDLHDLVKVLEDDPLTRQAYLPVWFPEDLGGIVDHKARVPCTLGYHFIRRGRDFHCIYPMRSCDFVRHFRDDVYLTIRLQQQILGTLKTRSRDWRDVRLGTFTMHITSLHCFESDLYTLRNKVKYG